MVFDVEQAERDGWNVEVWSPGSKSWCDGIYLAGPDDADEYAVWYKSHGKWLLSHVISEHIRNLQPKTVKVPVQYARGEPSSLDKYTVVAPGHPQYNQAQSPDGWISREDNFAGQLESWIRRVGYDPSTGNPLPKNVEQQCEHVWYPHSSTEWKCKRCGMFSHILYAGNPENK